MLDRRRRNVASNSDQEKVASCRYQAGGLFDRCINQQFSNHLKIERSVRLRDCERLKRQKSGDLSIAVCTRRIPDIRTIHLPFWRTRYELSRLVETLLVQSRFRVTQIPLNPNWLNPDSGESCLCHPGAGHAAYPSFLISRPWFGS